MFPRLFLPKPLALDDGRCLRTIDDAQLMIRRLPRDERATIQWQLVAPALLTASTTGRSDHIMLASEKLEQALAAKRSRNARLLDEKKPMAASVLPHVEPPLRRRNRS
jgi:hypothetical protein